MGGVSIALSRLGLIGALLLPGCAAFAQVQINQNFIPQGPAPDNPQGTTNSGAVQAILPDPSLGSGTVFIGSTNGGIWGTTNGGSSWTQLTDNQASLAIASLALDPTDPSGKTLIAGTGATSNASYPWLGFDGVGAAAHGGASTGLLYSTDGGNTWSALGTAIFNGMSVVGVAARGSTILAATFEPKSTTATTTPSGTAYGLYMSTNGGQSFNLVSSGLPSGPVTSLVADPTNNKIFYAAVKPATTGTPSVYQGVLSGSGASASISWTPVSSPSQFSGGDFLRLAAGPNGSLAVGVIAQCTSSAPCPSSTTTGNTLGFAVNSLFWSQRPSTNSSSWTSIPSPSGSTWSQTLNNIAQANVNFAIAIGPNNSIYVSGDEGAPPSGSKIGALPVYYISMTCAAPTTCNSTVTSITGSNTSNNSNGHTDSRAIAIIPTGNSAGQLLLGSDGGVYQQTSPQSTSGQWLQTLNNLQTGESYAVAYGANANLLMVARQDNGVSLQSASNSLTYNSILGGDGHIAAVNDTSFPNQSAFYSSEQALGEVNIRRVIVNNQGTPVYNQSVMCNPSCDNLIPGDGYSLAFVLNRANPSLIAIGGQGGTGIFVTQDTTPGGASGYTLNLTPAGGPSTGNTSALAYGTPNNPYALLAGVSILNPVTFEVQSGQLWFSPNVPVAGAVTPLSQLTNYPGSAPSSVVFDPNSPSAPNQIKFYVADGTNLWNTQTSGQTFSQLTSFLPTGFTRPTAVEFISNNGVNALLVGGINTPLTCNAGPNTPNGCVISSGQSPITVADSDTSGKLSNWRAFGAGLPNALISQMSYNPIADVLAVATAGRGAWTLYDVTSYFPQATTLQFGLANNDSIPAASYLTDGTALNGTTFSRPLNKYGTGTLTIASAATYTGGTTIYGGALSLGNGGTGGSILGNVSFCNDPNNPQCDPSTNKILAFNRSDRYAFGAVISGPGQIMQVGTGTTDLTGASTYTGPTSVSAGTLAVDGAIISPVLVTSGGTLGGAGTVGSTAIAPGAALQPGAFTPFGASQPSYTGIGTLTVAGDLMFFPESFYLPTTNSRTSVTGTATLAGAVLPLFLPGPVNKTSTILAASNPLTTAFDALLLPDSLSGSLTYTPNDVVLNLYSQLSRVPGLTPNETAVGVALDNAFNTNGGLPAFGSLYSLSPAGVAVALNQLSGQSLASEQTVLSSQALYSREAVLARLRQAGYSTSAGPQAVLGYAGPESISLNDEAKASEPLAFAGSNNNALPLKAPLAPASALSSGITFWAQGMGGWGKINGNTNAAGTTGNFAGVLSGADVRLVNNWLVGFALGYTGSSTNVSALASSAQVDTGLVAGYAGTNWGCFNLRLGGTYGINSVYTTRQIAFPGFMDRDTARFNAGTGQVFGEVGYGTAVRSVAVEPFAGLAYVHLDTVGFTESGGASILSASSASQDTGYSSLGVRAAAAYTLWNGMVLIPRASVAWQYAFGEINPATSLAFSGIPGSNFSVTGVPIARNAALIDAGADLRINAQAKLGLYYWGQQANTAHENGLRGTMTWMF